MPPIKRDPPIIKADSTREIHKDAPFNRADFELKAKKERLKFAQQFVLVGVNERLALKLKSATLAKRLGRLTNTEVKK